MDVENDDPAFRQFYREMVRVSRDLERAFAALIRTRLVTHDAAGFQPGGSVIEEVRAAGQDLTGKGDSFVSPL